MSDYRRMLYGTTFSLIVGVLALTIPHAQAPESLAGYKLPTKEMRLDPKALERVDAAHTVAVLATSMPFMMKEGAGVLVTYRAGRVGPDKAKADVMKVLNEWGIFTVIDDPSAADLVFAIQEETLGPSFMSDGKPRLKDTLAVFPTGGPGAAPPLWVGIDTENALAAASGLTTPDSEGVVERFRRDVENARKRRER
jgi:hypothetical protein